MNPTQGYIGLNCSRINRIQSTVSSLKTTLSSHKPFARKMVASTMDTIFNSDIVYLHLEDIRAKLKSKDIVGPDSIAFALFQIYKTRMTNPMCVGKDFVLTYIEQCLASDDRSEEEQASLAKKIWESMIDRIEHIRQEFLKTPSAYSPAWYDDYPNSVRIGRLLTAAYYKVTHTGLSSNELLLSRCHFVKDYEQMLGEAVIKAVLQFRFGVSSFDDLFFMAVDAAFDSKDIDEHLAHVIRDNGGPCDPDLFEFVRVETKEGEPGLTRLNLSQECSLDCFKPTITKLFITGNRLQHQDGYDDVTFREYLNGLPELEVIVFKDVGAYQSAFEFIATADLPKLKLLMIDTIPKYINENDSVYDPAKMVADLRKCLGYRPRNNLILMVRHIVPHTEESWIMVKSHSIGSMIPGFEYTPCLGVFYMIE